MATGDLALGQEQGTTSTQNRVVNDFSINVATVNGSGSQSANSVLLKSIFGMGVPVSGKNLFPSNIAGLPTWYIIRASKDGYVARTRETEFMVALNPETASSIATTSSATRFRSTRSLQPPALKPNCANS
jgi:2-oxoglutarate/2-oxoacid ferredoxin oxidoreductase subunit alpha